MAGLPRFPFDERFDAAPGAVVRSPLRAARGPLCAGGAVPFRPPPFDEAADPAPEPPPDVAEPPPPTFTQAELDAAVERAHAEAEEATRRALEAAIEQRRTEALEAIGHQLATAEADYQKCLTARAAASRELALALARALVPRALARAPLADIEEMLRDLLGRLEGRPRLELALPPDLVAEGRELLNTLATEAGYEGEHEVVHDPSLGPGSARLRWQGGAAVRDLGEIEAEVRALAEAWLPGTDGPDGGPGADAGTRDDATVIEEDEP